MKGEIRIDEGLWASTMAPEGILDHWCVADGEPIETGQKVAEVVIEGARHEILAPVSGVLVHARIVCGLVEPGDVIGRIS